MFRISWVDNECHLVLALGVMTVVAVIFLPVARFIELRQINRATNKHSKSKRKAQMCGY
jgi:hypothetical protein